MAGILGLGIYKGRPELAQDVIASEATGCLLFERALRFAAQIKAARPDMVIIGRDYLSVEDQKAFVRSPEPGLAGLNWAIRLCSQYPAVDVWQCMNEMYSPGDFSLLQQQVITEIGFVEGCMMMNKTACVFNFAYGSYPTNDPGDTRRADWPRFLGIIRPLLAHKAKPWLGLHAYGRDARARMDIEPEWNALRHRFLVRDLRAAGVTVPPIAITEYGQADGWRPWLSPEQCMADFVWFGSEVLRDIAAGIDIKVTAAFSDGDSGGFHNFDVYGTGIVDSIAEWNRTHPVASIPKSKEETTTMPNKLPELGNEYDPSPNCDDRPKPATEGIVIHSMEGSFDSARAWFKNTASQVSAHYLLRKDGYLLQMVPEGKRAWHAGTKSKDKTGLWGAADFNGISVGIELEGFAGQPFTDQQYDILRTLVWYLVKKYAIPFDRQHIVAHSELSKVKGDPGSQFRWDFLMGQQPKPAVVDWQAEATKLKTENERLRAVIEKVKIAVAV